MTRLIHTALTVSIVVLWLATAPPVYGDDTPPTPVFSPNAPGSSATDRQSKTEGPKSEPLFEGIERARFLRAVGTDTELDEQEFDADQKREGGFVRPDDRWEDLVRFDKNRNGKIDWLEAWAYRKHQLLNRAEGQTVARPPVELSDRRLIAEQRRNRIAARAEEEAARTEAFIDGIYRLNNTAPPDRKSGLYRAAALQRALGQAEIEADEDGDGILSPRELQALRKRHEEINAHFKHLNELDRMDLDGDGIISEQERSKHLERRRQWILQEFDQDGDGVLDELEYETFLDEYYPANLHSLFKKHDKNKDGVLDESEDAAYQNALKERMDHVRKTAQQQLKRELLKDTTTTDGDKSRR